MVPPAILDRLAATKTPEASVEAAELFSHREKNIFAFWIVGRDLQVVAARSRRRLSSALHIARAIAGDPSLRGIHRTPSDSSSVSLKMVIQLSLLARLRRIENSNSPIIVHRDAPFVIVISDGRFVVAQDNAA